MQVVLSAFDKDASLDVLDHPVLNLIYYMVLCYFLYLFYFCLLFIYLSKSGIVCKQLVEILPSALVLYILRKLPPKRISAQYHPIR